MVKKDPKEKMKSLLFEIGTEELPATHLADIFESAAAEGVDNMLLAKWKDAFVQHRLVFEGACVWATPRRLVFYMSSVAAQQDKKDQLTRLMARAEAYDAGGQPTEKFITILKHRNVSLADTVIQDLGGKETIFIRKAESVQKTTSVLPELLPAFVKSLSFPKNMKWDDSGVYFPRPIRHTLCLYGDQPVRYAIGRIRSSSQIKIFSKSKRLSMTVSDIAGYFKLLKKQGILLDPHERKSAIRHMLDSLAKSSQGRLYDDPFLMSEVNFLVENPKVLAAPFDAEFLKLPLEVLTVSMARKQRIFGLVDKGGQVMPKFLAIADGAMTEKEKKIICRNYENILHAKLQDSLFFYKEDLKVPLDKKRHELKNLIFLKRAGSMLEKSERLERLSKQMASLLDLSGEDEKDLLRAAYLSKCDLLTQMVGEFPELQGVIGKYYATAAGEKESVAAAIGEQYLPRTVSDQLPSTRTGALLSLLDKVDLITACFALGMEPTSSMDPYGLRRSASAVLKIMIDQKLMIAFDSFLGSSQDAVKNFTQKDKATDLPKKIKAFYQDRFKAILVDRGLRPDSVDAALASGFSKPYEVFERAQAVDALYGKNEFIQACKVVERTSNILRSVKDTLPDRPDRGSFTEPLEGQVWDAFEAHAAAIEKAITARDFAQATSLYARAFFDILNEFFDKVFINADDMNVRRNRLSLLRAIRELYTREIADLSKIEITKASLKREN